MIPQRRFAALLDQAKEYQQERCLYHNAPTNARTFSLYADHRCDKDAFPRVTTAILQIHEDEVWGLQWSHSGNYLATASKDKTAIIWRIGVSIALLGHILGLWELSSRIPTQKHENIMHNISCENTNIQ